jgi:pilus assembly protein CpaE
MILIIDPVSDLIGRLKEARPDIDIRHVGDAAAGERVLEDETIATVVLGAALHQDEALDLAKKLHEQHPSVTIVLATRAEGPEVYRQAMRAGVSDVLPARADSEEIGEVLDRAVEESNRLRLVAEEPDQPRGGTIISTFATKGGCGKSFVATNLATLLAERYPHQVVLVDLDLQAGDAALMLQLVPERGLAEVAELGEGLDDEALRGHLTATRDLYVLAAPSHPIHAEEVSPEVVVRVLQLLREMFKFVIVDGPPFFTEQMLAALELIDTVAVVSSLDVPSIKNLRLCIETLSELGVPRERMKLVLNRADSKVGLNVREVEKSLGTTIDLQLPSSREVPFAVNQGLPIVTARPKSPVSKALRGSLPMFDQVGGRQTARARGSRRRSEH